MKRSDSYRILQTLRRKISYVHRGGDKLFSSTKKGSLLAALFVFLRLEKTMQSFLLPLLLLLLRLLQQVLQHQMLLQLQRQQLLPLLLP